MRLVLVDDRIKVATTEVDTTTTVVGEGVTSVLVVDLDPETLKTNLQVHRGIILKNITSSSDHLFIHINETLSLNTIIIN